MQMIFAVKKRENKITEGLRTVYRCPIEKKKYLLLMKGDAVTPQILFRYVEFLDGGKWEKHFPVLFSGNMAQLRISGTFDICYQTKGGGEVN